MRGSGVRLAGVRAGVDRDGGSWNGARPDATCAARDTAHAHRGHRHHPPGHTQYYSKYDLATFKAQTSWIADASAPAGRDPPSTSGAGDNADPAYHAASDDPESDEHLAGPGRICRSMGDGPRQSRQPGQRKERRSTLEFNERFPADDFVYQFARRDQVWTSLDGTSDNSYALFTAAGRDSWSSTSSSRPGNRTCAGPARRSPTHSNRASDHRDPLLPDGPERQLRRTAPRLTT